MTAPSEELKALLERIKSTPDFSYVDFSDIHATNALGNNALSVAVVWGEIDAVKLLVAAGLDINKQGEHGFTPLHYACEFGHFEIVKFLLDAGANPFLRTVGDMPFTVARQFRYDAICDLLSQYMKDSPFKSQSTPENRHLEALRKQVDELEKFIADNCGKK